MLIDLTIPISEFTIRDFHDYERISAFGHIGTHIDIMDKAFPLPYVKRNAVALNVRGIFSRDIDVQDVDLSLVKPEMFVVFYSGFIEEHAYGSKEYMENHPQLSNSLINVLLERKISMIGLDFAGVRHRAEHRQKDQLCADHGVFIVENLCNLWEVLTGQQSKGFIMNTFPVNFTSLSGLPCRVVAEL